MFSIQCLSLKSYFNFNRFHGQQSNLVKLSYSIIFLWSDWNESSNDCWKWRAHCFCDLLHIKAENNKKKRLLQQWIIFMLWWWQMYCACTLKQISCTNVNVQCNCLIVTHIKTFCLKKENVLCSKIPWRSVCWCFCNFFFFL